MKRYFLIVIITAFIIISIHTHVYFLLLRNYFFDSKEHLKELDIRHVEIVIASYGNDLSWLTEFSKFATIYEKKALNSQSVGTVKRVLLPNTGREAHTYLYHIVHNYWRLANVTVFSQANKPNFGYKTAKPNQGDGGHYYCPLTLHDYVTEKKGLFMFTEVMNITNGRHMARNGFNNYWKQKRNRCLPRSEQYPIFKYPLPNSCFPLDYYESYSDHYNMIVGIAEECNSLKDTSLPYPCSKIAFWNKYIKLPLPPNNLVYFAQGGLFSATREQIHRRPLDDYKILLDDFSTSKGIYLGLLMEFFWYPLVRSESIFCDEKYYNPRVISAKMFKSRQFLECIDCAIH